MQFITNGPDIPDRLLQLHEEGRVVFFCGAGISFPAGLPGFGDLVKKLVVKTKIQSDALLKKAIRAGQYDRAVGLLETRDHGGREGVRQELPDILKPDPYPPENTATHEALLTLGRNRKGDTRLVTTNFDRLFEEVIASKNLQVEHFQAPLLPVPKARWDGLVYLHGLLSPEPSAAELDRLVISSGDFGLAYLTERWAAQFVSELFRNYTVCFVGYSLNDPVLRYMTDALAADRLMGESPREMFAFDSFSKGKEVKIAEDWRAKNVTPVLYRAQNRHTYLHKTLRVWADTYRDGVYGKEKIVVEYALSRPLASTKQDDFVGRMIWALSDASGLPAKRFAELDLVPSLDWLEPLSTERFHHADLALFGVPPKAAVNEKLSFSLTHRPPPYDLAPPMALVGNGVRPTEWDEVMRRLADWLTRHLNDPKLLLWLVRAGGQPHDRLVSRIESRLEELTKLEENNDTKELNNIRANAPMAIPGPAMRTLWRLLLTGRVRTTGTPNSALLVFYRWERAFKRDGLSPSLRLLLRQVLTPYVSLREPFRWPEGFQDPGEPQLIRSLVGREVVLSMVNTRRILEKLPRISGWPDALPDLLTDFSALLRDALDLMRELEMVDDQHDHSYMEQPSISEHPQNLNIMDWTVLIALTRDAWLETAKQSPARARNTAEVWWETPYPLFRRMAFFAAAHGDIIPARQALDWLLADSRRWLWNLHTRREVVRLLIALAPRLAKNESTELEQAVLAGPPPSMYNDEDDPDLRTRVEEHAKWLRLAKIAEVEGVKLGRNGQALLDKLTDNYGWQLSEGDRDEFSIWVGGGVADFAPQPARLKTPRRRRDLVEWLEQHSDSESSVKDDWQQRCRDNFPTTACSLCALARKDIWPSDRWKKALETWSEERYAKRAWRYLGKLLANSPMEFFQALIPSMSLRLLSTAATVDIHNAEFVTVIKRILALDHEDPNGQQDLVIRAINHPVGHATEALLNWWLRKTPEDGQGLPIEVSDLFSRLCETNSGQFRHGRLLLTMNVLVLFRVDRGWTEGHLLPLFDWRQSKDEACSAWTGFLHGARLYPPLMNALKSSFLDTAMHYAELGQEQQRRYASLLTFAALETRDIFSEEELAAATGTLPPEGLQEVADALVRALESAGEQREEYWKNRVQLYIKSIWPNSNVGKTQMISQSFAELCIAARKEFPDAVKLLRHWLQPLEDHHELCVASLCGQFPEAALTFLDLIIGEGFQWLSGELNNCLNEVGNTEPRLANDQRFTRLRDLARQAE